MNIIFNNPTYFTIFIFFIGLLLGSFANVCIWRIPRNESVCFPRSHCCACNTPVHWYDNIPVLSYIILQARCRNCKTHISIQYPLIELLTGILMALISWHFIFDPLMPVYLIITFILIVVSGIDFHHHIIPDFFSYSLLFIGLAISFSNTQLGFTVKERVLNSLSGVFLGGSVFFVIALIGEKVFKKEALGGGDIKLLAGLGSLTGWQGILPIVLIASLTGSVVGLLLIVTHTISKRDYIPFGPFIALGGYITILLPDIFSHFLFAN
jgi:leader peptidase (prepilin peptidase)/N-methyltransferase